MPAAELQLSHPPEPATSCMCCGTLATCVQIVVGRAHTADGQMELLMTVGERVSA